MAVMGLIVVFVRYCCHLEDSFFLSYLENAIFLGCVFDGDV